MPSNKGIKAFVDFIHVNHSLAELHPGPGREQFGTDTMARTKDQRQLMNESIS
jgi:hypothetical protein